MIQRIQTVYLLLAAIGFGVLFRFPFAISSPSEQGVLSDGIYNIYDHPLLIGLTIAGILLSIGGILLFNNRKLQSKITIISIICAVLVPAAAMLLMLNEGTTVGEAKSEIEESLGIFLPIVSIIFGFLAYRAIQKDEKIVKSMDRLR